MLAAYELLAAYKPLPHTKVPTALVLLDTYG
jgi:hypothetical protein